jgi:3-phosphoshikimate 1-carboxyvinyltransferase
MEKFASKDVNISCIDAPASKSVAQRALLAAALAKSPVTLINYGSCDDVNHIKAIAGQLGAEMIEKENTLYVHGGVNAIQRELDCGESGLGIRLTTSIASSFGGDFTIMGSGSLLKRPLTQFAEFLPKMGVSTTFNNDLLPLKLSGQLKGGKYTVDGSLSSQYISGLLMALPLCKEDSVLTVNSPTSIPYIDITLDVLKTFGIKIKHDATYENYIIVGKQTYQPNKETIQVDGDWSGAAFWVVYGLLKGNITIKNLRPDSTQADIAILDVVKLVGSSFEWVNSDLVITKNELKPFDFDATHCPDLFPILVTLAAGIKGKSTITGVDRLKYKESDRGLVLQTEFKKLGLRIDIDGNLMTIYGTQQLENGEIDSNNDHRIAMAGAVSSLLTNDGILITNAESVNKSYPEFWQFYNK